jgi:integrase
MGKIEHSAGAVGTRSVTLGGIGDRMAIRVKKTRYGLRYNAMYRTVGGAQKSAGTFSDKKLAQAAYNEAIAKVLRGIDPSKPEITVYPGQVAGQVTLDAFAWPWIEKHDVTHNVRETYKSCLNHYIIPKLGARPLADVSTGELAEWLREIDKLGKPALTAKIKAVLSALFHAAAEDKTTGVKVNPVRDVKLKRHPRKRRIAFSRPEYEKFRAELDGHWWLLCDFIVLHTGVRWEEAMGLQKEDVRGGVVYVGSTLHELKNPARFEYAARTKTGRSRQIEISQAMQDRIAELPDGFLFTMPDGSHIKGDYFRKNVWKPALKAVGMQDSGLVPRDMRRTHATLLRAAGASREAVSKRLGHTNLLTTQIYLAEPADTERGLVGLLD